MAASSLNNVIGFYLLLNSNDYPNNYSPNLPFGFTTTDKINPVFSYSLDQIRASFTSPREFKTLANYNNTCINNLIVEAQNNENLSSQNITSNDWKGVFKVIEWAYMNQAIININKPTDSSYKTYANEVLAATRINEEENIYYVSNYINGSFSYETSTKVGRLSHIMFKMLIASEQVYFDIFFDADSFMTERISSDDWYIYAYEDDENDGKISEKEWDEKIVKKLWEIQRYKHYNRVDKFITTWCRNDASVPGGWTEGVQRTHYLFNNYPEKPESLVTREMKKNKVKEWVLKKNNNNYEFSAKEYPELFSDQQVLIVPVYGNYRTGTDGQNTIIHPLSKDKLEKVINRFFNESVMMNTDKLEIFYVGSDGSDNASRLSYIFPLIAGEITIDDVVTYPISSRFPDYYPRILDQSFNPGNNISENFHFLILKILGYHNKIYTAEQIKSLDPAEEIEIVDSTPAETGYVQFKYKSCIFKVMAPWETTQTA